MQRFKAHHRNKQENPSNYQFTPPVLPHISNSNKEQQIEQKQGKNQETKEESTHLTSISREQQSRLKTLYKR